ncbi:hypothetical protein AVEN_226863-1 [Araneus ventricosus]|uniref:Uncharacterized protein n=1 Tax=Araneus ventricosus TaxID=182803 RepID=A0A4Y2HAF7_ARAVE|nr:hypothetical protein AVEN_226863-1 [Araneus ventricosus]
MDLVILNRGHMTRTTRELAPPSPNFHTTPEEDVCPSRYDLMCNILPYTTDLQTFGLRSCLLNWRLPALQGRPLAFDCLRVDYGPRCCPPHLTMGQKYEIYPKLALLMFESNTV